VKVVEIMTPEEIESICRQWPSGRPPALPAEVTIGQTSLQPYAYGAGQRGVYVNVPGPVPPPSSNNPELAEQQLAMAAFGFLPLGLALSFFVHWPFSAAGQPGNMVRLMAFNTTRTLRRSIALLAIYFSLIYFPLVVIFCCARIVVPGLEQEPDRIMPAMTFAVSEAANVPWLAGILVAAPFAAAMSTVDSFMLMISSALVRDIYQHHVNPEAKERTIKRLSYLSMIVVGSGVTLAAINPPKFLQYFIVFAAGGLSTSFLVPMLMTLYWRRSNTAGILAAMMGGLIVYLSFYLFAFFRVGELKPVPLFWLDQFVWGVVASAVIGIVVTKLTPPPDEQNVARFFPPAKS
jgi:SSS family solute:Na+ symporter/sodium/pantothenate symporter